MDDVKQELELLKQVIENLENLTKSTILILEEVAKPALERAKLSIRIH